MESRTIKINDKATITIEISDDKGFRVIECEGWLYDTITFSKEDS